MHNGNVKKRNNALAVLSREITRKISKNCHKTAKHASRLNKSTHLQAGGNLH